MTLNQQSIAEIMNPKLLYIQEGDRVALARSKLIEFGVTCIPVLDETHRPVGMVSLRDLATTDGGKHFTPSGVVVTVKANATVAEGARILAESDHHHLVVVDDKGIALGMVSSLDFVRAFAGVAPRRPIAFDRY